MNTVINLSVPYNASKILDYVVNYKIYWVRKLLSMHYNNPTSAYATHILNNNHEYGPAKDTVQILKKCDKGIRMNCWEAMLIQTYYHKGTLVTEQQVNEHNPLFELMNCKQPSTQSPNS